ncbi:hypothetical protein A2X44_02780 [candidate division CPR3 bacterium GWF2_35_18]|uniref:Uncharacterized protein n=1 Tax=candidate division CPR3 bacterium GW2011_GWF2_35_18 TaxID=1618350 RepID=A0A0G0BIX2_UNCC3|nr:MAG: hypothetical protein UR67_C0006G0006 [candidate division CPR3 bacterium GW2011_GWF2_35_18]KKP86766.1 MAG: hypothetical protein UR87_C0011G0006 [candidate division CPR3 bacterium GW2011_GWE2_35_7]OGB62912.1 MAG: hypothetical protein A2X44_02780 [candidate division CPR3 bacterium GWF2_35_18]OGB65962.1 MAG: hypothetical protein A2250_03610 [candidate division CPR3 bacterium RIFOXYA2_FULL_35_13]OGB75721.1 MAG: hypothetical protein A2476_05255 [candidate division CPR3 bacterium RIFOXYC2_FULL
MQKKVLIFILLLAFIFIFSFKRAKAFEAQSENFRLDWGNLNDFAGQKSSDNYSLVDTGGQIAPGLYESDGFKAMIGFEYLYSIIPFTFTISNSAIDFGTLSIDTPKTDTTNLIVTSGAAHGYQVTASENNQLDNLAYPGTYIEDTRGDNLDITYLNNGDWNINTTYGFGYTLANITGTDAEFTSGYKQFSDESNSEPEQIVMNNIGITQGSEVQVTYKINIGATQESGTYQNRIKYICTGTF